MTLPLKAVMASLEMVEFVEVMAGIYFRSVFLPFKGMSVPQHVHSEDHPTLCGRGKARLYVNDRFQQDISEGHAVTLKAGQKHSFEALEDNTRLICVWDVEAAERMKENSWPG